MVIEIMARRCKHRKRRAHSVPIYVVPACAHRAVRDTALRLYQLARRHRDSSRRGCENAPGAAMIKVDGIRFVPVPR